MSEVLVSSFKIGGPQFLSITLIIYTTLSLGLLGVGGAETVTRDVEEKIISMAEYFKARKVNITKTEETKSTVNQVEPIDKEPKGRTINFSFTFN